MPIPVLVLLQNPASLRKAKEVMFKKRQQIGLVEVKDRDGNNVKRMNLLLFGDEGDLFSKGLNAEWAKSFYEFNDEWERYFEQEGLKVKSFLDLPSIIFYGTATTQALVASDLLGNEKKLHVLTLPNSKNYRGYAEGTGPLKFVPIKRAEVDDISKFYDHVFKSTDENMAAMVYTSDGECNGIAPRKVLARQLAVDAYLAGVLEFLACTWSSKDLHIFVLETLGLKLVLDRMVSAKYLKVADFVKKQAVPGKAKRASKKAKRVPKKKKIFVYFDTEGDGIKHYQGCTACQDYPTFVSLLLEAGGSTKFKSVLFGSQMVARGASICSSTHKRHLSAMYVNMPTSNFEHIYQVWPKV